TLIEAARAARQVTAKSAAGGEVDPARPVMSILELYPNPFNRSVQISVELRENAPVRLMVYDLLGRLVDTPTAGSYTAGRHTFQWSPSADLASGRYWLHLETPGQSMQRPVTLLK
ncbi:T9SS type A sorting domain-containing protein, partial [bacterium]|nr:T9SS type A sorting domain-containing protein [bacterium]